MEKKYASIKMFTQVKPLETLNEEFALCKVYVQGVGKNRNYSYMSKENVEKALPTLNYVPVVGHLIPKYDADGNVVGHYFGGHDYEITPETELQSLTVPFGVVVQDSFAFEDVTEFGQTVPYLTADIILWQGRYPELKDAIYSNDVWFSESMEISVDEYRPLDSDSNYTELLNWTYSALCLLGLSDNKEENTEPCFISSKVVPVEYGLNKTEFTKTMDELKTKLSNVFAMEGGKNILDEETKNSILAEFEITADNVNFEITDEMTVEDFRAKLTELKESFSTNEGSGADGKNEADNFNNGSVKFSTTYEEKRSSIQNALDSVYVYNDNGGLESETSYYLYDFDDTYAFVERCVWTSTDYQSDYGRLKYTFNNETLTTSISEDFEIMVLKWLTIDENQKLEDARNIFEELAQFKKDRLKDDHDKNVIEVLSGFEDIYDTEEFSRLLEKAFDIDKTEDIETQCFAIRGKHVNFENQPKDNTPKIHLPKSHVTQSRYGDLFDVYSKK